MTRMRLLLLGLLMGLAALGYFSGAYEYLAPERLGVLLTEAGPWGPLVVIVIFSLLEPFGAPGAIFLLSAATLWSFWPALLVNWLGSIGAGMCGFAFARYFGRDWVEGRMPTRLRIWDQRLADNGLPAVILFRLCFFLNPASHWALGLSSVPTPTALLGTAIGFVPWVVAWTYFGAEILTWFEGQSSTTWIAIAMIIAAFIAFRTIRRRSQIAQAKRRALAGHDG